MVGLSRQGHFGYILRTGCMPLCRRMRHVRSPTTSPAGILSVELKPAEQSSDRPARRGPYDFHESMLVDDALQRRLGFTNHALERFAQRAGLPGRQTRMSLEPVLRDLLNQEGRVVAERPHWARSRNTADGYVQVGDWLLLICRHDELRANGLTVVTIVNGAEGTTWQRALQAGYIGTPPPQDQRPPRRIPVSVWQSIRIGISTKRSSEGPGLISRIVSAHSARRADARALHDDAMRLHRERLAAYDNARRQARENHRRRHA